MGVDEVVHVELQVGVVGVENCADGRHFDGFGLGLGWWDRTCGRISVVEFLF